MTQSTENKVSQTEAEIKAELDAKKLENAKAKLADEADEYRSAAQRRILEERNLKLEGFKQGALVGLYGTLAGSFVVSGIYGAYKALSKGNETPAAAV